MNISSLQKHLLTSQRLSVLPWTQFQKERSTQTHPLFTQPCQSWKDPSTRRAKPRVSLHHYQRFQSCKESFFFQSAVNLLFTVTYPPTSRASRASSSLLQVSSQKTVGLLGAFLSWFLTTTQLQGFPAHSHPFQEVCSRWIFWGVQDYWSPQQALSSVQCSACGLYLAHQIRNLLHDACQK